jgi:nitrate/TMAO reductase-like tetraheme cytochrome c subunit
MSDPSESEATNEIVTTSEPLAESEPAETPVKPRRRRRWPWVLGAVGAVAALFIFFIGSVTLLDYTESTEFCSLCHIMSPEHTAYMNSPHSGIDCGTCHIGPGVIPAIQGKLAAVRYLWVYPLNLYEKPIPSPIHSLRPTTVVCEQCHAPQKFYEDRLATIPDYAPDEQNSLTQTQLLMKTGGGSAASGQGRGIHWHIENPVYYIATDEKRQDIPWVSAEYNGKTTEYLSTDSTLTPEQIASAEKRKMDCVDCHNRATHVFQNPDDALNEALKNGAIAADLPYIKQYGLEVLGKTYATEEEAAAAIAGVTELYQTQHPDVYAARQADVATAVAGLQAVFDKTAFPFMNVDWKSHPNNVGHENFPGCFRCHDGKHLSSDNQAIRLECNICHSIPAVALPGQPLPPIQQPNVAEPESHHSTTWLAEHRYSFDATCEACHTVDNPGGSDNSSFCSNSACHATEWKYAGLNAPRVRELSAPPKVPSTGEPPAIPHPIGPRTDCQVCHGPGKVKPYPDNHTSFTPDMCTSCHQATLKESSPTPAPDTAPTPQPAPAGGAPAIPHDLAGRDNCLTCHNPYGGLKPAPPNHVGRTSDTCQTCHKPAATTAPAATPAAAPTAASGGAQAAPAIPHDLAGRDNCLMCHNPDGDVKPAPADHAGRTIDQCQMCHKPAASAATPEAAPTTSSGDDEGEQTGAPSIPHDLAGRDNCLTCHDPNNGIKPAPANHAGRTVDTCQTCHKATSD